MCTSTRILLIITLAFLIVGKSNADNTPIKAARKETPSDTYRTSPIWYLLSQTDTNALFQGMPQRLGRAVLPSRRDEPMWKGDPQGGKVKLDLRVAGEEKGEIFLGFFTDPRWWIAEPVQVRRFAGPGQYVLGDMIPGKFYVGAMIGGLPRPRALGVHKSWPAPVEIVAGKTTTVDVLVSDLFQNQPAGKPQLLEGFAARWEKMDPSRMITIRTVDEQGNAVPFCGITLVERDEQTTHSFHNAGTDHLGYAYFDQIDATFSVVAERFDFIPELGAARFQQETWEKLYNAEDRPTILMNVSPFPTGNGKFTGRVLDQHGVPLTEYYVTLSRMVGNFTDWSDRSSYQFSLPVIDEDGRYEIDSLAPGTYTVSVRHFDIFTHVFGRPWSDGTTFTIPDDDPTTIHLDIEVEAKELRYGRAVFADGTPVTRGSWMMRFSNEPGDYFGLSIEPDGSFRVPLSHEERKKLSANSAGLVELRTGDKLEIATTFQIDTLSLDAQKPAKVVIPVPGDADKQATAKHAERNDQAFSKRNGSHDGTGRLIEWELLATDGQTHRLSDYNGRPVLLNVFATWCGPCERERPHLMELQRQYQGLVILAISRGEEPEAVEHFAQKHRLPFPVLIDELRTALDYEQFTDEQGKSGVPTNILLDQDHNIVFADAGFSEEKFAVLRKAVDHVFENSQ